MEAGKNTTFTKQTKPFTFTRRDSISEKIKTQLFENQTQKMRSKVGANRSDKNVLQTLPIIVKNYDSSHRLKARTQPSPSDDQMSKSLTLNSVNNALYNSKIKELAKSTIELNSFHLSSAEATEQANENNEKRWRIGKKTRIPTYNRNLISNAPSSSLNRYYSVEDLASSRMLNQQEHRVECGAKEKALGEDGGVPTESALIISDHKTDNEQKGEFKVNTFSGPTLRNEKINSKIDTSANKSCIKIHHQLENQIICSAKEDGLEEEVPTECALNISDFKKNHSETKEGALSGHEDMNSRDDSVINTNMMRLNCNEEEIYLEIRIELDSDPEYPVNCLNKISSKNNFQNHDNSDTKCTTSNSSLDFEDLKKSKNKKSTQSNICDPKVITKTSHKSVTFSDIDYTAKENNYKNEVNKPNKFPKDIGYYLKETSITDNRLKTVLDKSCLSDLTKYTLTKNHKQKSIERSSSYNDPDPLVVESYINSILRWSNFYCRLNPVDTKSTEPHNLNNIDGCWNIVEKKASLTTPEEFFICTKITDDDIFN